MMTKNKKENKEKIKEISKKKNKIIEQKIIKIINSVKKNIIPENKSLEEIGKKIKKELTKEIKQLIKEEANNKKINFDIIIGGSLGKGTYLKKNSDIDFFIRFKDLNKEKINLLKASLDKLLKKNVIKELKIVHGSRDYFQAKINYKKKIIDLEFVPVNKYSLSEVNKIKNSTDASPLHVIYAKKHLNKKKRDEVRLLKQFCKANKIYGAESYKKGFSGHVLELLIIKYGSFIKLLEEAKDWKEKKIILLNEKDKKYVKELNKDKKSPLIIIDPVQKIRNAAAALSEKNYNIFKEKAKEFFKNPSKKFFTIKKDSIKRIIGDSKKGLLIKIITFNQSKDINGSKAKKTIEEIKNKLERKGFIIKKYDWFFNEKRIAYAFFEIKNFSLPKEKEIKGPPLNLTKAIEAFKKKHQKTFVKNNYLFALEKNKIRRIEKAIEKIIKEIKRVKKISLKKIKK